MLAVPPKAINLRTARGSQLEIVRCVPFTVTLGDITLLVETLVLPILGPDMMLLANNIMGALGAIINWNTKELSFANPRIKVEATHRIKHSTQPNQFAH